MSKIIIVKDCNNCPKASISLANSNKFCYSDFEKLCPRIGIPDWCPLPDLPKHKEEMEYLAVGYNKCLDDILEG